MGSINPMMNLKIKCVEGVFISFPPKSIPCISSPLSLSLSANYTSYLHLEQSLALAHADIDDGKVLFVPWVETDFRTGEDPWWS
jgi:hypothetical protein